MTVVIGSDHAGYALKSLLADKLTAWGHNVEDVGAHSTASVDYPEYGRAVGERVVQLGGDARGVCVCGSGIGISLHDVWLAISVNHHCAHGHTSNTWVN